MKKLFLPFILLVSAALPGGAAQIIRGPYLEDPTQTTLILHWQTSDSTPAWLEYGPAPRCNQLMTITPAGTRHKAVLYGLVPNQEYCYRLYVENSAQDGVQNPVEGSFKTLFSPERKEVQFLAIGNTGAAEPAAGPDGLPVPDPAEQARMQLAARMKARTADFLIHTGNLTHSGLDSDADREFFTPFKDVLARNPLLVALGPNEYGPNRAEKSSKPFLRANYSQFHNMSWGTGTPKYYSFDTANARFIFLDANTTYGAVWAPSLEENSAQIKWLKTSLTTNVDGKWKIVVINAPLYSTGATPANNEAFAKLSKLFEDYKVNLVLQGNAADYERTFPMWRGEPNQRGVVYMTLGGGGAQPQKRASSDASTARYVAAYHYAQGKIVDRKMMVKVYDQGDKLLDTVELYL